MTPERGIATTRATFAARWPMSDIGEFVRICTRHRRLIWELTKRDVLDRFAGSTLGVLWSVLNPLALMGIYVAVFTYVFPHRAPAGGGTGPAFDYTVFMISAYLPWMVFAQVLHASGRYITGRANLVTQVVFPLEALPIKSVLGALVPQLVGTVFLLGYTLVRFQTLPVTWLLWPVLLVCEIGFLLGIAFFLAALGVYLRDTAEIAGVLGSMLFYLTPILFTAETIARFPGGLKWLLTANPLTYYVTPFRDIMYTGAITQPAAWGLLPVISAAVLLGGYGVFRRLKPYFGSAL